MKKLFTSTFVAMLMAVVLPVTAFAASTLPGGESVTVTCTANGNTTTGTANAAGTVVQVPTGFDCPNNSEVNLFAGTAEGTFTGTGNFVNPRSGTVQVTQVDLTNPTQVPEFGLLTGAVAMLTSGGSLLAFRRMRKA